jgi:hypothetical protein
MIDRFFAALLLAGIALAAPVGARSQSPQPPLQDRWPAPAQELEQRAAPPAAEAPAQAPQAQAPAPEQAPAPSAESPPAKPAAKPAPKPERAPAREARKPAPQPTTVACTGVFAPNSSHQALESAFNAKNVSFTEVEGGPVGSKLMASVLFPNDPKRRLEVLWQNEDERSETYRIVITGQSTWSGPKGLRLGLPLAAVEKINGKPFKLQGFDQSNSSVAIDWQDGALASLPGGCNVGVFFAADPKTPQAARAEAAGEEFASSDAAIRAVKPTVTEILFGYPK